jgi:hypothetical protein
VDRKWHPEKAHVLKVLFPTGGAFGKWLDHDNSDPIHVWIHNLMALWKVVEIGGGP